MHDAQAPALKAAPGIGAVMPAAGGCHAGGRFSKVMFFPRPGSRLNALNV